MKKKRNECMKNYMAQQRQEERLQKNPCKHDKDIGEYNISMKSNSHIYVQGVKGRKRDNRSDDMENESKFKNRSYIYKCKLIEIWIITEKKA